MKKVRIPRQSKTMVYFGQRTEKDAPIFVLSQALRVWGPAPAPIHHAPFTDQARSQRTTHSMPHANPMSASDQGELFA